MKILFISKYPPIEGGVSSQNYWLARALGCRGCEVSIITNSLLCEEEWRAKIDLTDISTLQKHQPQNVFFYSLKNKPPFHIPYSDAYLSRLVNLGLKVISERGADIIYAHYLEPYASAGFILKKITGLPLVLRHAGSDIYRLFRNKDFRYFLSEVIAGADKLVFSETLSGMSAALNFDAGKLVSTPKNAVDPAVFNLKGEKFNFKKYGLSDLPGVPIIVYLGKATENKGISEAVSALSMVKRDFRFVFVSGGREADKFISEGRGKLGNKFIYLPFIPPWEVPALIRSSSAVLHLENKFSIPIHSPIQPYEVIGSGTPLILSREIFNKMERNFSGTRTNFSVIDDPGDIGKLGAVLSELVASPGSFRENAQKIREEFLTKNDWNGFVDFYFSLFESLVRKKSFLRKLF